MTVGRLRFSASCFCFSVIIRRLFIGLNHVRCDAKWKKCPEQQIFSAPESIKKKKSTLLVRQSDIQEKQLLNYTLVVMLISIPE